MAIRDKGAEILLTALIIKLLTVQIINIFCLLLNIPSPSNNIYTLFIQITAILIPALWFSRDKDLIKRSIVGAEVLSAKTVFCCMLIGCCLQPVVVVLNYPLGHLFGGSGASAGFLSGGVAGTLIFAAFLPALCEEFLFRGVILTSQKGRGALSAIVAASVYFALLHTDISSFAGVFILGIVLGITAVSTNSVIAAMIVHIFNNSFGVLLRVLESEGYVSNISYLIMAFIGACLLAVCMRQFPLPKTKNNWTAAYANLPFAVVVVIFMVYEILAYNIG